MDDRVYAICDELLSEGTVNELGKKVLAELLKKLPLIHQGKWGAAFVPLTKLLVRTNVDLFLTHERRVLLTWRDDEYFKGWHFPGGCLGPGEHLEEAAKRIAFNELGVSVSVKIQLVCFNNPDNHRSHDSAYFMQVEILSGEVIEGEWFDTCPEDIIAVHIKNWDFIEKLLKSKF